MKEGQASRTAELVAFSRALHQVVDRPLVLEDPIAPQLLSARGKAALAAGPGQYGKSPGRSPASKLLRAGLVCRSRVAEDTLAAGVARGVTQYLVLGAGFDTFAYRNPHPHVRVFEVDHPSTQALKRERLTAASIPLPHTLTFVPFDFTGGSLADALAAAGFDANQPTVVAWLGVSMYLSPEDVATTVRYVGSLPASTIVFDFYPPVSSVGFVTRFFYKRVLRRLERAGEPWLSFYTPAAMRQLLADAGFARVEILARQALNARYLAGRRDRLDVGPLLQIAVAAH